jgi:hypothetical protein
MLPSDLLALEQSQSTMWKGLLDESEPFFGPPAPSLVRSLKREAARTGRSSTQTSSE